MADQTDMITPQTIEPWTLPSKALLPPHEALAIRQERQAYPYAKWQSIYFAKPAVYFLIGSNGAIFYIGSCKHLDRRLLGPTRVFMMGGQSAIINNSSHERYNQVCQLDSLSRVHWLDWGAHIREVEYPLRRYKPKTESYWFRFAYSRPAQAAQRKFEAECIARFAPLLNQQGNKLRGLPAQNSGELLRRGPASE